MALRYQLSSTSNVFFIFNFRPHKGKEAVCMCVEEGGGGLVVEGNILNRQRLNSQGRPTSNHDSLEQNLN